MGVSDPPPAHPTSNPASNPAVTGIQALRMIQLPRGKKP
jgi:hypothetical protein